MRVAAAIIRRGNRLLVCQRPKGKARALKYEFPGGKPEGSETDEEALIRECREELDVELKIIELFTIRTHAYTDVKVRISFFLSEIADGEPKALEHNELRWVTADEAAGLDFCGADMEIVRMLNASPGISELREELFKMRDEGYARFSAKLIPNIAPESIIGIRTPQLRIYIRNMVKTADPAAIERFIGALPHKYYEENNIHAALIEREKELDRCIAMLDEFLPYMDNWATCDSCRPRVFDRHPEEMLAHIDRWLASDHPYTVRFGLGILMRYLDSDCDGILERAAAVRSDEYYVNMMIAWFFATALAKRYDETLPYIREKRLSAWVHNKAIQKARESRRVGEAQKQALNELKI